MGYVSVRVGALALTSQEETAGGTGQLDGYLIELLTAVGVFVGVVLAGALVYLHRTRSGGGMQRGSKRKLPHHSARRSLGAGSNPDPSPTPKADLDRHEGRRQALGVGSSPHATSSVGGVDHHDSGWAGGMQRTVSGEVPRSPTHGGWIPPQTNGWAESVRAENIAALGGYPATPRAVLSGGAPGGRGALDTQEHCPNPNPNPNPNPKP